jgi:hypothetical protein
MPELVTRCFVPSAIVVIVNDGPELSSTTYWDSAEAANGFVFLSYNDGALRLLVPPLLEHYLPGMTKHVREVVLTRGRFEGVEDGVEVMFEDDSNAPFALHLDPKFIDRRWTAHDERNGTYRFAVYTRDHGKVVEFARCWLRRARQLPCLQPWTKGESA